MSVVVAETLPVLESERLRLRAQRDTDTATLFALYGDPLAMRYWSSSAWIDAAQVQAHLQRTREAQAAGALPWGIAMRKDDALIGTVTLFNVNNTHRRAELGYALSSVHWGRGLASEALRAVLHYAFDVLDLQRIEADTDPRNASSRRLLERFGFVHEGTLRCRWYVNDEWCDSAWYGLLHANFAG